MKKLIPILAVFVLLISCNKEDDSGPKSLELNSKNISGVWFPSQVVKSNGTMVNVPRLCETKRDTINIKQFGLISSTTYFSCDYAQEYIHCDYFIIGANNKISSCEPIFDGYVTELTGQKMRIDYDEPLNELSTHEMDDMKALILTRN